MGRSARTSASTLPVSSSKLASGQWQGDQFPTTFSMWTQQLLQRQRKMVASENFGSSDPSDRLLDVYVEVVGQLWGQSIGQAQLNYLRRKVSYVVGELKVCETSLLASLCYMQRLRRCFDESNVPVDRIGGRASDVLIVCLLAATKFLYDIPYSNAQWAETAGVDKLLLNQLELELLASLGYSLEVSCEEISEAKNELERGLAFSCRPAEYASLPQHGVLTPTPSPIRSLPRTADNHRESSPFDAQLEKGQQYELWSSSGSDRHPAVRPAQAHVAARLDMDIRTPTAASPPAFSFFQYLPTPPLSNLPSKASSPSSAMVFPSQRLSADGGQYGMGSREASPLRHHSLGVEFERPRFSRMPSCPTDMSRMAYTGVGAPRLAQVWAPPFPHPPAVDKAAFPLDSCRLCASLGPCLCNALANEARRDSSASVGATCTSEPNSVFFSSFPHPNCQPYVSGFAHGGLPTTWSSYFSHAAY
eukprot:comp22859_c0_seq1/m.36064 comp22859_c0_seq1/g.36064  ORF comp22859_c0_seq1/g.36064 comp22859_c0_seq1/m.36064 type:complete len:475 (-) comp22859_c0_seq1:763-2187(-)